MTREVQRMRLSVEVHTDAGVYAVVFPKINKKCATKFRAFPNIHSALPVLESASSPLSFQLRLALEMLD